MTTTVAKRKAQPREKKRVASSRPQEDEPAVKARHSTRSPTAGREGIPQDGRRETGPYLLSGSSTISLIMASVVSMRDAIEAAFWRAVRVTLVGSMTPALTRSSYSLVVALKP